MWKLLNPLKFLNRKKRKPFYDDQDIPVFFTLYDEAGDGDIKKYLEGKNFGKNYLFSDFYNPSLDLEWVESQNKYVESLSKRDVITASGYSHYGNEIINNYIYDSNVSNKKIIFPFFSQIVDTLYLDYDYSFDRYKEVLNDSITSLEWVMIFKMYIADLSRIIGNSPPLKKHLQVWTGVNKKIKNGKYLLKTFKSTSFNKNKARGFGSYLISFIIVPGTHVLFLAGMSKFPSEFEILLQYNVEYRISSSNFGDNSEIKYLLSL